MRSFFAFVAGLNVMTGIDWLIPPNYHFWPGVLFLALGFLGIVYTRWGKW